MIRLEIYFIGKTKEAWLKTALGEYESRLKRDIKIVWVEVVDDARLVDRVPKDVVLLDPNGASMTSEKFSEFFYKRVEAGGCRVSIAIGGAEGLPDSLRKGDYVSLSLSKMTLTHQMSRLLLLEQIYRAVQIQKGTPYHK